MSFLDVYRAERARLAAPASGPPAHFRPTAAPASFRPHAAPVEQAAEFVLLPGYCSLHRQPQLISATRRGNQFRMLRCEIVPPNFDASSVPPPTVLGTASLDTSEWTGCAHCRAKSDLANNIESVWWCTCARCAGNILLQCAGNRGGLFRCINDTLVNMRSIATVPTVDVQGWRSAAGAHQPAPFRRDPPLSPGRPSVPQIEAPPSTTLRIGLRGRQ